MTKKHIILAIMYHHKKPISIAKLARIITIIDLLSIIKKLTICCIQEQGRQKIQFLSRMEYVKSHNNNLFIVNINEILITLIKEGLIAELEKATDSAFPSTYFLTAKGLRYVEKVKILQSLPVEFSYLLPTIVSSSIQQLNNYQTILEYLLSPVLEKTL